MFGRGFCSPSGDILPASSSSLTLGEMKERADEGLRAAIASLALLTNSRTWWLPFCMRWVTSLRSWLQREKMAVSMSWRSMILLVQPSLVLRCRFSTAFLIRVC